MIYLCFYMEEHIAWLLLNHLMMRKVQANSFKLQAYEKGGGSGMAANSGVGRDSGISCRDIDLQCPCNALQHIDGRIVLAAFDSDRSWWTFAPCTKLLLRKLWV